MRFLEGEELAEAMQYMELAAEIALESTCKQAHCGAVVVKKGEIIGAGYNSPPGELESQCRCENDKELYHKRVTDKTCCVHAEQRAISDALKHEPEKVEGATIYFIRIDMGDGVIMKSGKPYCTHCSKRALDEGLEKFVLWHEEGVCEYGTEEYNDISYEYQGYLQLE